MHISGHFASDDPEDVGCVCLAVGTPFSGMKFFLVTSDFSRKGIFSPICLFVDFRFYQAFFPLNANTVS